MTKLVISMSSENRRFVVWSIPSWHRVNCYQSAHLLFVLHLSCFVSSQARDYSTLSSPRNDNPAVAPYQWVMSWSWHWDSNLFTYLLSLWILISELNCRPPLQPPLCWLLILHSCSSVRSFFNIWSVPSWWSPYWNSNLNVRLDKHHHWVCINFKLVLMVQSLSDRFT